MVFSENAMKALRDHNVVIWLDTEPEELERRIRRNANRGIAAEPGTTVSDLYAVRRPLYDSYADIHIKCRNGTDRVVFQIIDALKQWKNKQRSRRRGNSGNRNTSQT